MDSFVLVSVNGNVSTRESFATPFDFEAGFDYEKNQKWFQTSWVFGIYLWVAYMVAVYGIQHLMKERPRFELRKALFFWNLGLAVFSVAATIRTFPEMIFVLTNRGFYYSACLNWYTNNPVSGFWNHLFVLSKAIELGDTIFIVLRKQPLSFLHVYHHSTVLVTTWYGYAQEAAPAAWFIFLNFLVHSFMYSYYCLKCLRIRVPRAVSMSITVAQMTQMILAGTVVFVAHRIRVSGSPCLISPDIFRLSFFFYITYLILFANFFRSAYLKKQAVSLTTTAGASGKANSYHLRIQLKTGFANGDVARTKKD